MPHNAIPSVNPPAAITSEAPAPPPRTQRDPALDGLRGLAVLMVFLFHYGGGLQSTRPAVRLMGYITQGSWLGVVLFFALSGFLITGSLWDSLGQPHRLRNFYVRRVLRIFPIYFLALGAAAAYALYRGASLVSLKPLAVFVFFLQDLPHLSSYALQSQLSLPLYHLWTVAVEEQFYLIWPIVLLFAHSRRHALRLSLWIFAISVTFLFAIYTMAPFEGARTHHLYDYFLLTQAGPIALGAAVSLAMGSRADASGRKPGSHRLVRRYARPAFFTGCAIYLYTSYVSKTLYLSQPLQFWLGLPAIAVAAAAVIPLVLRPGPLRSIFSMGALGWMGRISYGFYVYHILLEPLFDHIGLIVAHASSGEYYQIVRLVFAFPITCLVAWISFHLYELPILNLKRFFPMSSSLPWGEPVAPVAATHHKRHRSRHSKRPT